MNEEWRDIEGYEGLYKVSSLGRIMAMDAIIKKRIGAALKSSIYLKPAISVGYYSVTLTKNRIEKKLHIHRLMAKAFILNPNNNRHVNHINGVLTDNRLENLEWVTERENCCHRSSTRAKTSKYTGVSYRKDNNVWVAIIYINKKTVYLGRFRTEEEAHQARVKFEKDNNIINKYLV